MHEQERLDGTRERRLGWGARPVIAILTVVLAGSLLLNIAGESQIAAVRGGYILQPTDSCQIAETVGRS